MGNLFAAAIFFVLLHRIVSGTPVRAGLVRLLGEKAYLGCFALLSVAGVAWLGWAYARAPAYASPLPPGARDAISLLGLPFQLAAVLLVVAGMTTPNPGTVAQEAAVNRPEVARGILRVTRHPFLWGIALWAGFHFLGSATTAGLVLFGSLLFVAVTGTLSIDRKRRRSLGPAWDAFAQRTSNVPFGAIVSGRQHFSAKEIGLWRPAVALLAWTALLLAHP